MSNNVIAMEYTLIDANSKEQLDTNVGGNPLEFISGMGQIIPGLEKEIGNLASGEKADVMVQPAEGYGEYNEEAVQVLPKEQFAGIELNEGMTLYGTGEDQQTVQVMVKSFTDDEVTIDYNHPLAGKTLMFSVSILDVRAATDEEIQTGVVGGLAAMGGGCCSGGSCGTEGGGHSHGHEHSQGDSCCGSHTGENAGGCSNH